MSLLNGQYHANVISSGEEVNFVLKLELMERNHVLTHFTATTLYKIV